MQTELRQAQKTISGKPQAKGVFGQVHEALMIATEKKNHFASHKQKTSTRYWKREGNGVRRGDLTCFYNRY